MVPAVAMAGLPAGVHSFRFFSSLPASRICIRCLRQARDPNGPSQRQQRRLFAVLRTALQELKSQKLRVSPSKPVRLAQAPPGPASSRTGATQYLNMTFTGPTVVYQAPSHTSLIVAASCLTLFFGGYGVFALREGLSFYIQKPAEDTKDEINAFVPPVLVFASVALTGLGLWMTGAVRNLVKKITVLPQGKNQPLLAQLEVTRWNPFRRHEFTVSIRDVTMARRMQHFAPPTTAHAQEPDIQEAPMLLRPFLSGGRFTRAFFHETRNVFMRQPFVTLNVRGQGRFSLDSRGMAYRGSQGLDQLIAHDPGHGKFWDHM